MCHEAFGLGVCGVANYAFYKTAYLSHKYIIISFLKNTIGHWNTSSAFSFVHNITGSLELPTRKGKHNAKTAGFLARSFQKPELQIWTGIACSVNLSFCLFSLDYCNCIWRGFLPLVGHVGDTENTWLVFHSRMSSFVSSAEDYNV